MGPVGSTKFVATAGVPLEWEKSQIANAIGTPLRTSRKAREMNRNCHWMSGPSGTDVKISAAKWWLAISRDVLAKDYRRQMWNGRPPVHCQLTPKFVSPLTKKA